MEQAQAVAGSLEPGKAFTEIKVFLFSRSLSGEWSLRPRAHHAYLCEQPAPNEPVSATGSRASTLSAKKSQGKLAQEHTQAACPCLHAPCSCTPFQCVCTISMQHTFSCASPHAPSANTACTHTLLTQAVSLRSVTANPGTCTPLALAYASWVCMLSPFPGAHSQYRCER